MRLTKEDRDAFVRAVLDDVPMVDYQEQFRTFVSKEAVKHMPAKLRAVYLDPELRGFLRADQCIRGVISYVNFVGTAAEKVDAAVADKRDEFKKKHSAQREVQTELRHKLSSVIGGCHTLKQAQERLPEFEKYLPKDRELTGTANLPAIANVVADLTKAGWPKGKKPTTTTKGK